jgi:hypothetical protein
VRDDVIEALERVGKAPDLNGNLRLYHATEESMAEAIVRERVLRAKQDDDPAMRALQRGGGSVFLASSPAVGGDLGKAVILAVDVDAASTPAEVLRADWGDPPRVELESRLRAGEDLALMSVERLDRTVDARDLPDAAQKALALFQASPVGEQLSEQDQQGGNCQRASIAFLAALRRVGADGTLLAWGLPGAWHCAVLVAGSGGVIVDWTAGQFESEGAEVPYPRVETKAQADARWGDSNPLDIDSALGRSLAGLPRLAPWEQARERFDRPTTAYHESNDRSES